MPAGSLHYELLNHSVVLDGADHAVGEDDGQGGGGAGHDVGVGAVEAVGAVSGLDLGLGGADVDALGGSGGVVNQPGAEDVVGIAQGVSLQVEAAVVVGLAGR